MSFYTDDDKQLGMYKTIWSKIKVLKTIELNAFPVYDDRYLKSKIRTHGDKVYTNFVGLKNLENNIGWESFTVISIDSLFAYENKYYLKVYVDNCAYKIVHKRMADYLDENVLEIFIKLDLINFLFWENWYKRKNSSC